MNKIKKLLFGFVGGLLLSAVGPLRSAQALDTTVFDTALQVSISTNIAAPTQILAATYTSSDVMLMLNWSGSGTYPNSEFLLLSTSSTGFSSVASTGTVRVTAGQRPSDWLYLNNFRGPLYGVVIGTNTLQNVSIIRKK